MKTIYFHIGTVKTGSTFLQKTMWENQAALEEQGLCYLQVTPPAFHLPRYANCDFINDPSLYETARTLISECPSEGVIISEEGLFGSPQKMSLPIFDGFRKEVIVYIRRPAELISSWAAENAEPYNAFIRSLPGQRGPFRYDMGLMMFSFVYAACIDECFGVFGRAGFAKITVRPYEKEQFYGGSLWDDFLVALGADPAAFRLRAEAGLADVINPTRSRKFYDVSYLAWKYLSKRARLEDYSLDLVERIVADCQSGDDRRPIETIDDETIAAISDHLEFIEQELALRGLAPPVLFRNRFPEIYGTLRERYRPVAPEEIEQRIEAITRSPSMGESLKEELMSKLTDGIQDGEPPVGATACHKGAEREAHRTFEIGNPHRAYEKISDVFRAIECPSTDFAEDFGEFIAWCAESPRQKTHRRVQLNMSAEPYGLPENASPEDLIAHARSVVEPALSSWRWLYEKLEDDDSRTILLNVLAYRCLGWRYVSMPLDTGAFWNALSVLGSLERNGEVFDLRRWGFDLKVFGEAFGIFNEFIYSQYVYRGRRGTIGAKPGDYALDCGACVGGTSLFLADIVGDDGRVFSFEFFPDNILGLNRNIDMNPHLRKRVMLVEHPVWGTSGRELFITGHGPAAQVFSGEEFPDRAVNKKCFSKSIDDFVREQQLPRVDFIKMDIEGTEMQAIRGAKETIAKHRPLLAIAVYHQIMDFYEIPQEIDRMNLGYRFYLQHSTVHGDETVLFAQAR